MSHRTALNVSNGFRLLDARAMGAAFDSCALCLFSIEEIEAESMQLTLQATQGMDLAIKGGFMDAEAAMEAQSLLRNLCACGFIGDHGSMLVVDAGDSSGKVYLLTTEELAVPITRASDIERSWESMEELIYWIASDPCAALGSSWNFVHENGDQLGLVDVSFALY